MDYQGRLNCSTYNSKYIAPQLGALPKF